MKDGGPAFPCSTDSFGQVLPQGMSLRDYFAAAALPAIISSDTGQAIKLSKEDPVGRMASIAYGFADALLAEREKP